VGKYRYLQKYGTKENPDPRDARLIPLRLPWWVSVDGSPINPVPLEKSKEVKLQSPLRSKSHKNFKEYTDTMVVKGKPEKVRVEATLRKKRQDAPSTRQKQSETGEYHGGLLNQGIQVHRLWFQYLKLALELENLGKKVEIVTQSHDNEFKNTSKDDVPDELRGVGALFRTKETKTVKVKRNKYEGWDLDQVLNDTFNNWWKTHHHLFEGVAPDFLSKNEKRDDSRFLYVKLDKTLNYKDVRDFIRDEVQTKVGQPPKFQVIDYPRPDVCQNGYNALVLVLKGWTAPEICNHKNIYLRATDGRSKDQEGRPSDRLQPSIVQDKILYSKLVSQQMFIGRNHLMQVIEGKFGNFRMIKKPK
jgi:hypothetical protein